MKSLKKKRGFTLIELLVVIAIIGTLATIVMVSLNTARSKARDTRRAADLKSIALALEMYYDAVGSYPASTASLATTYIPAVPTDPQTVSQAYSYCTASGKYVLGAKLENNNTTLLANDIETLPTGCAFATGAVPADCTDTTANFFYCIGQ
jgi:type II secretion system protein G